MTYDTKEEAEKELKKLDIETEKEHLKRFCPIIKDKCVATICISWSESWIRYVRIPGKPPGYISIPGYGIEKGSCGNPMVTGKFNCNGNC